MVVFHRFLNRSLPGSALALCLLLSGSPVSGQVESVPQVGREFLPCVIRPSEDGSPLPDWVPGEVAVDPEAAAVQIPVPARSFQPAAGRYALTVVFTDSGDGGPAVEWRRADGSLLTLSEGLGDAIDDRFLGLNARTVLLPGNLTAEGGSVIVSYYGRFSELDSVTLQPGRESEVTLLGARMEPALVDLSRRVLSGDDVDGRRHPPLSGDIWRGRVVEAELSAGIEQLEGELEFIAPIDGDVEGVMVKLETLGLDLGSALQIELNGVRAGQVGLAPFDLDDPAVIHDEFGRLVTAGWRQGSVFLPARLWKTGDNHLIVRLVRGDDDPGKPVFLRNTALHVRFSAKPGSLSATPAQEIPAPEDDISSALPGWEEIDLRQTQDLIPSPSDPPLPQVITTRR